MRGETLGRVTVTLNIWITFLSTEESSPWSP